MKHLLLLSIFLTLFLWIPVAHSRGCYDVFGGEVPCDEDESHWYTSIYEPEDSTSSRRNSDDSSSRCSGDEESCEDEDGHWQTSTDEEEESTSRRTQSSSRSDRETSTTSRSTRTSSNPSSRQTDTRKASSTDETDEPTSRKTQSSSRSDRETSTSRSTRTSTTSSSRQSDTREASSTDEEEVSTSRRTQSSFRSDRVTSTTSRSTRASSYSSSRQTGTKKTSSSSSRPSETTDSKTRQLNSTTSPSYNAETSTSRVSVPASSKMRSEVSTTRSSRTSGENGSSSSPIRQLSSTSTSTSSKVMASSKQASPPKAEPSPARTVTNSLRIESGSNKSVISKVTKTSQTSRTIEKEDSSTPQRRPPSSLRGSSSINTSPQVHRTSAHTWSTFSQVESTSTRTRIPKVNETSRVHVFDKDRFYSWLNEIWASRTRNSMMTSTRPRPTPAKTVGRSSGITSTSTRLIISEVKETSRALTTNKPSSLQSRPPSLSSTRSSVMTSSSHASSSRAQPSSVPTATRSSRPVPAISKPFISKETKASLSFTTPESPKTSGSPTKASLVPSVSLARPPIVTRVVSNVKATTSGSVRVSVIGPGGGIGPIKVSPSRIERPTATTVFSNPAITRSGIGMSMVSSSRSRSSVAPTRASVEPTPEAESTTTSYTRSTVTVYLTLPWSEPANDPVSSAPPVVAAPSSVENATCSPEWSQCGGEGWTGPTCCASGTQCKAKSIWYSQCLAETPPSGNCNNVWGQCGGTGFTGSTCCVSGSTCVWSNEWYSQCLPASRKRSEGEEEETSSPAALSTLEDGHVKHRLARRIRGRGHGPGRRFTRAGVRQDAA